MLYPAYTAVIRTLGKAGDKFEKEIKCLVTQTVKPEKILAYIADGYEIPRFEGDEAVIWIRSPKGMVTQRSLEFKEVETEYALFLDDDVELPPAGAEKLLDAAVSHDADAVVANMFENHRGSLLWKFLAACGGTLPSFNRKWGFRVRNSTYYSYCNNPGDVMPAQSGAGPCSLVKMSAYRGIHFEDERWIELTSYALGDDLLFFNKIYRNGYKLIVHYTSGAVHLDARTTDKRDRKTQFRNERMLHYIIWHRISYLTAESGLSKFWRILCFFGAEGWCLSSDLIEALVKGRFFRFPLRICGIAKGMRYVKSDMYKSLPRFDAYKAGKS